MCMSFIHMSTGFSTVLYISQGFLGFFLTPPWYFYQGHVFYRIQRLENLRFRSLSRKIPHKLPLD